MQNDCTHLDSIKVLTSNIDECEECVKLGDSWVHLRPCTVCGNVSCCDNSKNKHATKHFNKTNHPVIKSQEKNEDWGYCYIDDYYIDNL